MATKDGKHIGTAELIKAVQRASARQTIHEQTNVEKISLSLRMAGRQSVIASNEEIKQALAWLKGQNMLSIS